MNPARLRDALSSHDADPRTVVALLDGKRRARRRRRGLLGGLAVLVLAATAFVARPGGAGTSAPVPVEVGAALPVPTAAEQRDNADAASACLNLKEALSRAAGDGVSIIVGWSRPTGRTAVDGYRHDEVVLTGVRTISGPPVRDGATAWALTVDHQATPSPGVAYGGPEGTLWGPDGAVLARYAPQKVNKGPLGAVVHQVPVVGDDAILLDGDCWNGFNANGLSGTPYKGPLVEIPGSNSYDHLARRGFVAVPLATIEAMVD